MTTRGRCLLAAGVAAGACALLFEERDLLRVAAFAMALPLLSLLSALLMSDRTGDRSCQRRLLPARVPVGGTTQVVLELAHRARTPAGTLLVYDRLPPELGPSPYFVLRRHREPEMVTLRYPLRPARRGIAHVGPLLAQHTDPFGLVELRREVLDQHRLVVTPTVVPLTGLPPGFGIEEGKQAAREQRCGPDPDDVAVRSYRHGDDLRKVHWRSTARRDELMVRVDEQPDHGRVEVLLDHRAVAHHGSDDQSSLEYAISLAASVCVHLRRHHPHLRFRVAGGHVLAGGTPLARPPNTALLDGLAGLAPTDQGELNAGPALASSHDLIAVLGAVSPAEAAQLVSGRPQRARSSVVLLDVAAWASGSEAGVNQPSAADPAEVARLFAARGWSAVVARPGDAVDTIWARLCAGASRRVGA